MEWKIISKTQAIQIVDKWQTMNEQEFAEMVSQWNEAINATLDDQYNKLRREITEAYEDTIKIIADEKKFRQKSEYYTDLIFGIKLYIILKNYGFNVRIASNDEVWYYLSVKVVPDIVQRRYPGKITKTERKNVNCDRFFAKTRRIYLKIIWWYIFLSMQFKDTGTENYEQTFTILKNNTTDTISQTVERSGKAGYRLDVFREIMRYNAEINNKYDIDLFRKVMVLNTARTQLVEPELMDGGVKTYVEELFKYFESK